MEITVGFFKSLFGGKQADTPSEIIEDIKQIQINDFNRIIKILEIADEESFTSARDTLGKFQNAFTTKFKTTKNFRSSPNDVRREYMSTLSSVLTRMNDMNMTSQALGVSIFTIIMYAIEMGDDELHDEIDKKLLKLFNTR